MDFWWLFIYLFIYRFLPLTFLWNMLSRVHSRITLDSSTNCNNEINICVLWQLLFRGITSHTEELVPASWIKTQLTVCPWAVNPRSWLVRSHTTIPRLFESPIWEKACCTKFQGKGCLGGLVKSWEGVVLGSVGVVGNMVRGREGCGVQFPLSPKFWLGWMGGNGVRSVWRWTLIPGAIL